MESDRPLAAVIVGAGSRGNTVFAELMATHATGFVVAGVVEPDPVRRDAFLRRHPLEDGRIFPSVAEFLAAPRFADVVFICTPDRTHFALWDVGSRVARIHLAGNRLARLHEQPVGGLNVGVLEVDLSGDDAQLYFHLYGEDEDQPDEPKCLFRVGPE